VNKQQIIAPLAVLVVVGLTAVLIHARNHRRYYLIQAAQSIGQGFVTTANSSRVVLIGPKLAAELSEFAGTSAGVRRVELGDEPGVGDGQADVRLYLTNSSGKEIGIRLQRAGESMFHVLSFWTPSARSAK
jgi:hypothetical protein